MKPLSAIAFTSADVTGCARVASPEDTYEHSFEITTAQRSWVLRRLSAQVAAARPS